MTSTERKVTLEFTFDEALILNATFNLGTAILQARPTVAEVFLSHAAQLISEVGPKVANAVIQQLKDRLTEAFPEAEHIDLNVVAPDVH